MRLVVVLIVTGLLLAAATGFAGAQYQYPSQTKPAAQSADVKTELKTAITHAGFAAGADSMNGVVQHLGHTLNCIEGSRGKNFNESWGNVCQGQGNGILEDLKAASGGAEFALVAQAADALAASGMKSKNLGETKLAAKGVAALLTVIAENMK